MSKARVEYLKRAIRELAIVSTDLEAQARAMRATLQCMMDELNGKHVVRKKGAAR